MNSSIKDVTDKEHILPSSISKGSAQDMFILFHRSTCPYCIGMMDQFRDASLTVKAENSNKDIRRCEYSSIQLESKPYGITTFPALVRVYKKRDGKFYYVLYDKKGLPRNKAGLVAILSSPPPS